MAHESCLGHDYALLRFELGIYSGVCNGVSLWVSLSMDLVTIKNIYIYMKPRWYWVSGIILILGVLFVIIVLSVFLTPQSSGALLSVVSSATDHKVNTVEWTGASITPQPEKVLARGKDNEGHPTVNVEPTEAPPTGWEQAPKALRWQSSSSLGSANNIVPSPSGWIKRLWR